MSEIKPLRWSSLVTFSITVCAIWAIVWALARAEHARLVRELSNRVATAPERDARLALRQMAQLREPPLEAMVLAATSPARDVAEQAQESLNELLRKWQHESKSIRGAHRVAARLERLAIALDAGQISLTELDSIWFQRTLETMLRLANAAPPQEGLAFIDHCESMLHAAQGFHVSPRSKVVPVAIATLQTAPAGLFTPPSRVALQTIIHADRPQVLDENDAPPAPPAFAPDASSMPRPLRQKSDDSPRAPQSLPADESTPHVQKLSDPFAADTSRSLLESWLNARGPEQRAIERRLRERGFGHLRADVARVALGVENTAERVQLVQDLPQLPAIGAKAWLMLLAEDADAEVRRMAVSVMATSRDLELLDCAWNVAVRDSDPRVAAMSQQLRDGRSLAVPH